MAWFPSEGDVGGIQASGQHGRNGPSVSAHYNWGFQSSNTGAFRVFCPTKETRIPGEAVVSLSGQKTLIGPDWAPRRTGLPTPALKHL